MFGVLVMIKMIISILIIFTSSSTFADATAGKPIGAAGRHKLSRERIQGSTAKIIDHKIVINFANKGLRFDLPLRPDLVKKAGAKIEPLKLSAREENDQEIIEYYDNEESMNSAVDFSYMNPTQQKDYLEQKRSAEGFVESKRKALNAKLEKYEKRAEALRQNIHDTYAQYDSMTFDEKERVNEMRRRVMSGLARFLQKQFKPGVYQVGHSSIDAVEEDGSNDIALPSLKEKWMLKILESFNIQLFSLGKRILTTNEYGWVAFGAPIFVIPKFGYMYVISLHVGYNTGNDRMYVRVSTSNQKAKITGGVTVGVLPSFFGFYAASIDTSERTHVAPNVGTYSLPFAPAMGFMGDNYAQISTALPVLPIGGLVIPTVFPYPFTELMLITTAGDVKMWALGSFAVKKLSIFSKSGKGPQIAQEITEMPNKKKQSLLKGILGMAQFWKKKECDVILTPVTQAQTVAVKN